MKQKLSLVKKIVELWEAMCLRWSLLLIEKGEKRQEKEKKGKTVKKESLMKRLREFLLESYEFRYNLLTEETELRYAGKKGTEFMPVTPRVLNAICIDAQEAGINCWDRDLMRFVNSSKIEEYHPFTLYMDELPVWDGKDRLRQLACRVSEEDVWVKSFHRWMLGVTAQWLCLTGKHANGVAPLLVSREQGKQKSTFCRSLMPEVLRRYYTDSVTLNAQGQTERKLAEMGLINMDEFDKFPANKMPLLKNLMQMPELNLRKAFQHNFRNLPRIASFIGTSNRMDLLTDPTGSRRFLCVEVKEKIDCTAICHEQIYAQLKAELVAGERYWFTAAEEQEIQSCNKAFCCQSPEEELFRSYYRAAAPDEECELVTLPDLFRRLIHYNAPIMRGASPEKFARVLTAAGVERKHTKYGNKYRVVALPVTL